MGYSETETPWVKLLPSVTYNCAFSKPTYMDEGGGDKHTSSKVLAEEEQETR